jgi:hypothetical protein
MTMLRQSSFLRTVAVLLTLVACTLPQQSTPPAALDPIAIRMTETGTETVSETGPVTGSEAITVPVSETAGTAAIDMRVVWPARSVQAMPSSVSMLDLTLKRGSVTIATRNIIREAASPSVLVKFERLQSGTVTLAASAKNSDAIEIAVATASFTLKANKRTTATLDMAPTLGPKITSFSPLAGGPGAPITVNGSNFSTDETKMAVKVGGVAVPFSMTIAQGTNRFTFYVPAGATTSAVTVTIDGVTGTSIGQFTTVGSLVLTPASLSPVATGSTTSLKVAAYDTGNPPAAATGAEIEWFLTNVTGVNSVPLTTPTPGPTPTPTPTPSATETPFTPGGGATGTPLPPAASGNPGGVGVPGSYTPPMGKFNPSNGVIDSNGEATSSFSAEATGSGVINVRSGTLIASMSVKVQ